VGERAFSLTDEKMKNKGLGSLDQTVATTS
jgi:hypothetical protein